ncbi:GD17774 [Drosophila simulans]|uniref:GD17774 n=1 Tax=Drosophila simulans TaxID=7240 RepID=B4QVJ4_DROSI|nr:GD17774 [Drosophila simulans]
MPASTFIRQFRSIFWIVPATPPHLTTSEKHLPLAFGSVFHFLFAASPSTQHGLDLVHVCGARRSCLLFLFGDCFANCKLLLQNTCGSFGPGS